MRVLYFLILIVILFSLSCEKKYCKKTEFSALLNGNQWIGHIKSCDLDDSDLNNDRDFRIIIEESKPSHDKFEDVLVLNRIPFEEGIYLIDSVSLFSGIRAEFWVLEDEYGTPTQTYSVIPLVGSFITVEEVDIESNTFVIKFNIQLSIPGGMDGELHNSTYDKIITFTEGEASGQFMD